MNAKKIAALFALMLALLVVLSVSVFAADGADTAEAEVLSADTEEETPSVGAENDAADLSKDAADEVVEDPEEDVAEVPTVGAETDPEVIATADTGEVTGTWSNLGTSGVIGIVVAAVLLVVIVVLVIVLIPKKGSKIQK